MRLMTVLLVLGIAVVLGGCVSSNVSSNKNNHHATSRVNDNRVGIVIDPPLPSPLHPQFVL